MKKLTLVALMLSLGTAAFAKSAAELEKEKALANPYANDLGPASLDVSKYPADKQAGYKLLVDRCAQCHQPSRPLNSQFAETEGKDLKDREAKVAALKKEHPELFKNKNELQVEADVWQRYVKRMMSKPGCGVAAGGKMTPADAKKIWAFLVYDSNERKIKHPEEWTAHRKKLLDEFKTKYPKRFDELYGANGKTSEEKEKGGKGGK
jgi:mono/diheme cytochrome c family protein